MIKHAVLQLKPEKGNIKGNLELLKSALLDLKAESPDVVVLPEAFLTAYFLQGGVRELALTQQELLALLQEMYQSLEWTGVLDLVVGFYEREGGTFFNSCAYLELGGRGILHVHRKVFLPTYGVFDEERYLSRGSRIQAFNTRFGRVGMLICEDFWHTVTSTIIALDGAQMVYVPSASPARGFASQNPGNMERWSALAQAVSAEHGVYTLLSSLIGFEGGKGMVGGSLIVSPEGKIMVSAPAFEATALLAEIDLERIPAVRYDNPLLADLQGNLPSILPDLSRVVHRGEK
ncbi:nitrilase-related carbon-nitrogen hydrolase [Deinococcus roseus]|uniref:Carbon-nitrogen hydrolase n=1 Tax=Deinococcus roseus TaxID=392414 RepID=A0ABQ2CV61_9DEIO|nr:nitrilase-related carbon-nitrogen hydrolase [Deinococcus roseus]GGJ20246.1 carbon-nitrogen hydrolase [Deinococcus roseus]